MSGYDGFSMSNNARAAYKNDEKPLSYWTKKELLAEIERAAANTKLTFDPATLTKVSAPVLRQTLLERTSWHHTGLHYNKTDFYKLSIKSLMLLTPDTIAFLSKIRPAESKQTEKRKPELKTVHYEIWDGGLRDGKYLHFTETCMVDDKWVYTARHGKKSLRGSRCWPLEKPCLLLSAKSGDRSRPIELRGNKNSATAYPCELRDADYLLFTGAEADPSDLYELLKTFDTELLKLKTVGELVFVMPKKRRKGFIDAASAIIKHKG